MDRVQSRGSKTITAINGGRLCSTPCMDRVQSRGSKTITAINGGRLYRARHARMGQMLVVADTVTLLNTEPFGSEFGRNTKKYLEIAEESWVFYPQMIVPSSSIFRKATVCSKPRDVLGTQ
jgi:hypothetical protein